MTTFKNIFFLVFLIKILSSSRILLEKKDESGKYIRFNQKIQGLNEIIHLIETSKEDLLSNKDLKVLVYELKSIIDLMQMKIDKKKQNHEDEKEGKALKNKEKQGKQGKHCQGKGKKKRIIFILKEILLKTEENLTIQEKIHEFLVKFNKKRS